MRLLHSCFAFSLVAGSSLSAAAQTVRPSDVETPEAVVKALYEVVTKQPGGAFQWDRFRTLFVPGALLLPNPAQSQGVPRQHTVESFIATVDSAWAKNAPTGSANDRGFTERETNAIWERFGDIAHVFSTYEKRLWTDPTIRGRGINTIQLVRRSGRWWVVAMAWDEASATLSIPPKYAGTPQETR